MKSRCVVWPLGVLATAWFAAGCGPSRPDYQESQLAEVLAHHNPSPVEKYVIDRPPVAAVRGNTAILRQGSLFAILVGPDLRHTLDHYPADARLGVRFVRDPSVYLVLERVFTGGESIDVFGDAKTFRVHLPKLVDGEAVPFDRFVAGTTADLSTKGGAMMLSDTKMVFGQPDEAKVAWASTLATGTRLDRECYCLGDSGSHFLVLGADPMSLLILDFLRSEKRPFTGGVTLVARVPPAESRAMDLAGAVRVDWIRLGGSMYFVSS